MVRPEILKSYMTEGYLGRIDPSLLKPYLALRSDWGQFEKGFDSEALPDAAAASHGLRDRFTRLSVMMKDLENLKADGISGLTMGIPTMSMGMPTIPTSLTGRFGNSST